MLTSRFLVVPALVLILQVPARAADIDPHVPVDTKTYFAVNVRSVLSSPLIKKHALEPIKDLLKETGADEIFNDIGIDPLKDIDRVIVAGPGGKEVDRGLIIVLGSFNADKVKKAAEARDDVKTHKTPLGGGVTHAIYEYAPAGQDTSLFLALANDKTIIASAGKDYVVDALKQSKQKKVVLKDKAVQQMIERFDTKQSVSVIVPGKQLANAINEALPKGFQGALDNVEYIGGGLTVNYEVKLDLAISTKDEDSARNFRDSADKAVKLALIGLALVEDNKALGLALEVVKSVKVGGRGKQVTLSAKLTADVLDDLFGKDN